MSKRNSDESEKLQVQKKLKGDEPAANAQSSDDEDVNLRARYFSKTADVPNSESLDWDEQDVPADEEGVTDLAEVNDLHHGDILNFGDHRDANTYIVKADPNSQKISLVKNPDDSGAGYLTIPSEILDQVSNFREKYGDVIEKSKIYVNFRLSSKDEYIRETLQIGEDNKEADGWDFDAYYYEGSVESFYARPPGGPTQEFEEFDLISCSWTEIKTFFDERSGPLEDIKIKVKLEGDSYEQYKNKYSETGKRVEWMAAAPELGGGWSIERGQSGGGSSHFHWVWKFKGPSSSVSDLKNNIDKFLEGFSYEYIE